ncbi:hypothetical protein [Qipengyuania gaetbuli]|uniref:hypothetical protein n=1 Tax=Qipengyuania gaetbuli TaxID=266952 RepID=UPI001CFE004E|nr:hypothetical protein [Qipengyuania gaetbuli]
MAERSTKDLAAARIDAAIGKKAAEAAERSAATAQTVNVLFAELVEMGVCKRGGRSLATLAAGIEHEVAERTRDAVNKLLPKGVRKLTDADAPPPLPLATHKALLGAIAAETIAYAEKAKKADAKRRKDEAIIAKRAAQTGEM